MKTIGRLMMLVLSLTMARGAVAETISGQVTDFLGQPVANADLDFFESATGDEFKPDVGDITDINGNYLVTDIPAGTYDVFIIPPSGERLAGGIEENVGIPLGGPAVTLNAGLAEAWLVSGTVRRADDGGPAKGVDLDFVDLTTGLKLFTPNDNSDVFGVYNVPVPIGIYEVSYDGPQPDLPSDPAQLAHGFLPMEISIDGTGDIELPAMTLELGYHVEGQVRDDQGDAVAGADLDIFIAGTDQEIFTKQDNTNGTGFYDTIVPAGTYDIEISPPLGVVAASKMRLGVVVAGDTIVGFDNLEAGRSLSGNVIDPLGTPLPSIDLDLFATATGAAVPTAFDSTDAAGHYMVRVPTGTYDIVYEPLTNKQVLTDTSGGETVFFDAVLPDMILPFSDADADGVSDRLDGCPFVVDSVQLDQDADGVGDLCDNCPAAGNVRQEDNDRDGVGDLCDLDDDNDGVMDSVDLDDDGDGIADLGDNCPGAWNPDQSDSVVDGVGDACDDDDGEVEFLAAAQGGFAWRPETGALGYRVYRQNLGWLSLINYGVCVHDVVEGTAFAEPDEPSSGKGFVYLVTASTLSGEGSMGPGVGGAVRPNLRACP